MALKMALFWISLVLSVISSNAAGEFSILYSPDSLKFSGSSGVQESLLKEVFSASLGLSVEENSEWDGLTISDPFNTPEAVVEVYVDGISSLGNVDVKKKVFPLTVDEYEPDTFDVVRHRIQQRDNEGGNKLVTMKLNDVDELTAYPEVYGEISPPKVLKRSLLHLKHSIPEDFEFLAELEALNTITDKVASGRIAPDNVVDFYNFRFRTLHALSDFHGPNSLQTKEAKTLLGEALEALSKAFVKAYDGSVLVTAVATDVAHTRRRVVRQTSGASASNNETDAYGPDYAAIFNIILWFVVVFAFSLIAIVYAIMDMDPGRDSIIYRMTNTRMKKDN